MMKIKNNNGNIAKNMAISSICKPISMIISFIYVPIVLNYLGVEKYGVWSTILTILSWISYFDIGIGNGLRNRLTESISKHDGKSKMLISSAYAFIATIMIVVTIFFSIIASFVNWNRIFGVFDINENLAGVVIISIVFMAINFVLSICKNVLYAIQKAAYVSIMELLIQVFNTVGILIAMRLFESNLFIMAIIYGLSMIMVNFFASIIIYCKNQEISPNCKNINLNVGMELTNLGVQFFVIQICALVLFTTDSLIISYLYGASDVTPYNTVNKLFNVLISIYTAMIAPIWSAVGKEKAEGNIGGLRILIKKLQFLMLPFFVGAIGLAIIFRPLTRIWLGQDLNYSSLLIILGALYSVLSIWCNTYASISNGLEIMKVSISTALVQATINIPLSLFFAEKLGMKSAGVLIGTILSMLVSAVVQPIAVHKRIR